MQQRRGEERLWRQKRWNSYLDKYSLQFEQIKLSIWTNAICNSERCGVQQRRGEERLWRKKRWNSEEEKAARDELKRREEKVIGQMNGSLEAEKT